MGIADFLAVLYRYLKPYRLHTFLLLILLLINTAFLMGWPLSFKFLIDKGISGHDQRVLILTLAALMAGVLIAAIAGVARGYLYAFLSANVLKDIRQRVFEHLQRLSMGYYARTSTGEIMARLDVPYILSRPDTCAALRTLVGWCTRALGQPFGEDYRLIDGRFHPVTRTQIDALI